MVKEDFNKRLKRIKERSKTLHSKLKFRTILTLLVVVMVVLSFIAYAVYQIQMGELEKSKKIAIENIKNIFAQYPHDPHLHIYIAKVESSNSIEDINRIIDEARRYIELKKIKEKTIGEIKEIFKNYTEDPHLHIYIAKVESSNSIEDINRIIDEARRYIELKKIKEGKIKYIKDLYGKYYSESLYAQSLVSKIQKARSEKEIEEILRKSNIEENAKMYYLIDIGNKINPNQYYIVYFFGEGKEWKGSKILDYIKKLSLTDLKKLSQNLSKMIIPATYSRVAIVVPATQCGNIPLEGSKVKIYDKKDANMEPIKGWIHSSYLLVKDINYSELILTNNIFLDDRETSTLSNTFNVTYSLIDVPGIIYATAAEKLDYYKVMKKFGRYGEKFNKITSDTQIFDEEAKYLLIVSVPSVDVPRLVAIKSENIYVAVEE